MARVLVTGGSGRLARVVTPRLREAGHQVTAFDVVPLPEEPDPPRFVLGDLVCLEDCLRAVSYSRAEVIVHLGALPGPREMIDRPGWRRQQTVPEDSTMRTNTLGTYYLLEAAVRLNTVRQVIFASSFYALGLGNRISAHPFEVDYLPIDEEHPLRPEDSYGLSKMFGEQMLLGYVRAYGLSAVAFRLMGVHHPHLDNSAQYGIRPPSDPNHRGGPIRTTYQYVDARDVAAACALAMQADDLEDFETFYLTTDTLYDENTAELARRVWPDISHLAQDIGGTEGIITDAKARDKLGYQPRYSWRLRTDRPDTHRTSQHI